MRNLALFIFQEKGQKACKTFLCRRGNHQNCSELENNTEALINQTGAVAASAAEGGQTADEGGREGGTVRERQGENEERKFGVRKRQRERQRERQL